MLIIWGFKVVLKAIGGGMFSCPQCRGDRSYQRMQARRWFTVFFIPVIPLKVKGEVVKCSSCGQTFRPEVLDMPTMSETAEQVSFARRALAAHMVDISDNTTVAREAAVQVMRDSGLAAYDQSQLDIDRGTSDMERVVAWAEHLGHTLSAAGAENVLMGAVKVAAADGALTDAEREALVDIGGRLGLTPTHIDGILQVASNIAKPADD